MTFLTAGLAIAGACAVAIPIIIHLLFRQRRRPIPWAAMRFLLEAFRKHRKRLRLEQWLLLAARCLILLLLGAALARPILESAGIVQPGGSRAVFLVIDNGLASGLMGSDGLTALERQIDRAVELVQDLGPGDAVGVLTASQPARSLLVPPSTDHGAVVGMLESLRPAQSPSDFAGAMVELRSALDAVESRRDATLVYLFSEFRAGSAELNHALPAAFADLDRPVKLVAHAPTAENVPNVQITGLEPLRSLVLPGATDGSGQITVRLRRTGGQLGPQVTRVALEGAQMPVGQPRVVHWQAGESEASIDFDVDFPTQDDRQLGLKAWIEDDALPADNQRYTVLELRKQVRVLLIDRRTFGFEQRLDQLTAGQWIRRALEPTDASPVEIVEVEPAALSITDARTADAAILPRPDLLDDNGWRILRQFVDRGGMLLVMPPGEVNVHQWTEHLSSDLGLPWRIALETTQHDPPLLLADEQPATELLRLLSSDLGDLARPVVTQRTLDVDQAQTSAQTLLSFANGAPMVIVAAPAPPDSTVDPANNNPAVETDERSTSIGATSRGMVAYLAAAPELTWTNLPAKPLMVPFFHELLRQGLSMIQASQQARVGQQPVVSGGGSGGGIAHLQVAGAQRIAVDQTGRIQQPLDAGGLYSMLDAAAQSVGMLAVNIDPTAGQTQTQNPAAVEAWLSRSGPWEILDEDEMKSPLTSAAGGWAIAGILLMLLAALIVAETFLARVFSHSTVVAAGEGAGPAGILPSINELSASRRPSAPLAGAAYGSASMEGAA